MTTTTTPLAELLTHNLARIIELGKAMLNGVDTKTCSTFPTFGDTVINTNHPVFIYGHLSIYPAFLLQMMGQDISEIEVPAGYEDLFKHGAECVNDPDWNTYPPMDEVVAYFIKAHEYALGVIRTLPDSIITDVVADEERKEFFGNNANAITFMLYGHYMFHMGQMSAWRRCMGLGHAMPQA